ncbi:probable beta-D-xylosidase 7 [Phragmites australis]|uniref:probable beta-D-xylosidase 7 n=1 Tax=Phragmites australis TaxID=29695 RepID=UPI002D79F681|nr:probable beta-D-xylosidase 7 [Phragmites australis]
MGTLSCHNAGMEMLLVLLLMPALLSRVTMASDPPFSCGPSSPSRGYPFCDASLPVSRRAADLVSRLTVAEKVSQLGDEAPGVPRLGVPGYKWWSEGLHGLAYWGHGMRFNGTVGGVTSFPQVLLTASAFDDGLWFRIGQAIGREARALYNLGQADGLTIWSPNVNIFRDPRWGRGQETPGEDPATASKYAVAFVRGLQGSSAVGAGAPLQASACCKHATAYDLEDWNGVARYNFDAKVTVQDLADTFNPPFQSCVVDGKASCVMCAYTGINGVPACASSDLLTKTFRGDWGLDGYVSSDCDAVAIMRDAQRYAPTPEDTVAVALKAGLDLNCGTYTQEHGMAALQQGKMTEQDVDKALINLFSIRMRLGHFDGDPRGSAPYGGLGAADVCTADHKNLALEAAQDGIVLLKNDAGILPLDRSAVGSAAAIGHNANDPLALIGNYFGPPCESTTPLKGLQSYVNNVRFLAGCDTAACNFAGTGQAVALSSSADYVFLFMGLSQEQEKEGLDRTSLLLPGNQQSLITAVASAAKGPVILVLLTGGPVDITFAQTNPKIGAILWAGYPGQAGGLAIARVLFGDHNPSGRLPVTWYPEEFTKVPMTDMRMRADPATGYPGRSYRFYQGRTIYKFGYGLSYSKFSRRLVTGSKNPAPSANLLAGLTATSEDTTSYYHVDEIGADGCEQLKFPAEVEVKNHGPMDGKHSVLMFLRWPNKTDGRPANQLIGFRSQHLKAGEKASVRFDVSPCEHFSRAREDGRKVIDRGPHFLMVDKDEWEISFEA